MILFWDFYRLIHFKLEFQEIMIKVPKMSPKLLTLIKTFTISPKSHDLASHDIMGFPFKNNKGNPFFFPFTICRVLRKEIHTL